MKTKQSPSEEKSECGDSLDLPHLDTLSSVRAGLFMLETSGRDRLTGRQACAVESAAARSGLQVVLILLSSSLSLRDILHCQFSVIIKLTATWPNKKQGQNVRVKATILFFLSTESSTTIIFEDLKKG